MEERLRRPGADRSLTGELARTCGIVATRCSYEVEAIGADAQQAAQLAVPEGAPLLVTHEILSDQRDVPISLGLTTYRGDAFRFKATLFRA